MHVQSPEERLETHGGDQRPRVLTKVLAGTSPGGEWRWEESGSKQRCWRQGSACKQNKETENYFENAENI